MAPADPPVPPEEPAAPPAPPEEPPTSPPPPAEPPLTMEDTRQNVSGAKPSEPGPVEPAGIAESILPQRREDAERARTER
jgi:hypothetical protein